MDEAPQDIMYEQLGVLHTASQRPAWVDAASLHNTLGTGPRAHTLHQAWEPYREIAHLQAVARKDLQRAGRLEPPPVPAHSSMCGPMLFFSRSII